MPSTVKLSRSLQPYREQTCLSDKSLPASGREVKKGERHIRFLFQAYPHVLERNKNSIPCYTLPSLQVESDLATIYSIRKENPEDNTVTGTVRSLHSRGSGTGALRRDAYGKRGPHSDDTLHRNGASVRFCNPAHDVQPKTTSALITTSARIHTIEPIK